MPWRVSDIVSERMMFVARLEQGERMSDLCKEYGISRTTGYKFLKRFRQEGPGGFFDRTRRPHRSPKRTSDVVVKLLVDARKRYGWGARKLKKVLSERHPGVAFPALSTISSILEREGLVQPRKRKRRVPRDSAPLSHADSPNAVWCADFKGEFRMGNSRFCYPLTISDAHSRFIIACVALESTAAEPAALGFEHAFQQHGLPRAIRTDNGTPFASARAALGLSQLSVWWRRLGITHERIDPGHPEQNGVHERMHRTLKRGTTRPPGANLLQQQERFDGFVAEFNNLRPHEALDDNTPGSVYRPSSNTYPEQLTEPVYPLHDLERTVSRGGHIRLPRGKRHYFITTALVGQRLGLRELDDGRWLVSFMKLDLGIIDPNANGLQPIN